MKEKVKGEKKGIVKNVRMLKVEKERKEEKGVYDVLIT